MHRPTNARLRRAATILWFLICCWPGGAGAVEGEPKTSPKQGKAAKDLVKVELALNWFPEAEHGGYYAALVHGYYRDAGLEVKIIPGGPEAPVAPQVARRAVTFGISNADNVLFALAQEAPVVAVMSPLQTSPRCILVHESSGIGKFEDLKDVTLAMSSGAAFAAYLKKKVPLSGVKIVPYPGNVVQFLRNKDYAQQGYVFSEPFVARKQGGDPRVLMMSDLGFNPYTSLLITHQALLREKPELVRKMVTASVRGWQRYLDAPDETNRRIHELNPEMDLDVLAYGAEHIKPLAAGGDKGPLGRMSAERWQTLFDQLVEAEQLKPGEVDPAKAFTAEFLPK